MDNSQTEIDDEDLQIDASISRIQNLIVYLKQMALHISATIKQPNLREYLKSYIENFDKTIDQYNYEYVRSKMKKLQYFQIQQIAIAKDQPYFIQRVAYRDRINYQYQQYYYANLVFLKDELNVQNFGNKIDNKPNNNSNNKIVYSNHYRMHVQIYKQENQVAFSNQVMSRFEKNCMNQIAQSLMQKGYVNHFDGPAIVLNCKKPVYRTLNIKTSGDLLQTIKAITERFIKNMNSILIRQKPCSYCNKHYLYDNQYGCMMPPTMTIWMMKEKVREDIKNNEERIRILHQVCALKYFKNPPLSQQYKMMSRQQQYIQHQQQQQNQN